MTTIVECVPNFSEGRDRAVVDAIRDAVAASHVRVLNVTMDADHNRSVITFAGDPASTVEAAFAAIVTAVQRINLTRQTGVHPRIGAADVVPFVPVQGITLAQCAELAHALGRRVWHELRVPVYFYEAAATKPRRVRLENIRRGEFESLLSSCETDPEKAPDIGGPALHPTAGAAVIGARKFLIAWNINLRSTHLGIARKIARAIRESSGGMPCVKALGVPLESQGLVQVSMNLTDFEVTPMQTVFDAVATLARAERVEIDRTEIIGLLPRAALDATTPERLCILDFTPGMILEECLQSLGVLL